MNKKPAQRLIMAVFAACFGSSPVLAANSDNDALWSAIQSLEQKVEATASAIEMSAVDMNEGGAHGHGGSGKTTIGGYGEMHFNSLESKSEMDFHRAVLFIGHQFDDNIRFFTEWDLEHAFNMELEQAYLEFDLNDNQRISAGVMLMPVGIINETHEPPVFYGVERNPIESKIIPTTWREGGVSLSGNMASGISYDLMLSTGLSAVNDAGVSDYGIRGGRQHVAKAIADNAATTARIKWTGMPGVELAASYQIQGNITQSADNDASARLLETHVVINRGPLTVKALYAGWNIDGADAEAAGKDKQDGWYVESAYKLTSKLGVFARYNAWDNEAGSAADTAETQAEVGANFWPHENVVVKMDVMQKAEAGKQNDEGFNVGIGYYF